MANAIKEECTFHQWLHNNCNPHIYLTQDFKYYNQISVIRLLIPRRISYFLKRKLKLSNSPQYFVLKCFKC